MVIRLSSLVLDIFCQNAVYTDRTNRMTGTLFSTHFKENCTLSSTHLSLQTHTLCSAKKYYLKGTLGPSLVDLYYRTLSVLA